MSRSLRCAAWTSLLVLALAQGRAEAAAESQDPIKLTLHDWTGQLITTRIMGEVLKKAGYNVEYVQADYLAQFAGLKTGDLHVAMEIWETTGKDAMDEAARHRQQVENLGETGMQAKEEWWYPAYMKEKCPGLPDWEALKERCAEAFSTPETAPKGRYLGGPVTWGGFDEERVEALELRLRGGPRRHRRRPLRRARERLPAQGAGPALDLHAALGADQVRGRVGRVPGIRARPATRTRPGASNPDATYDCGKPRGWIRKVGWAGAEGQVAGRLRGDQGLHRSTTTRWAS